MFAMRVYDIRHLVFHDSQEIPATAIRRGRSKPWFE